LARSFRSNSPTRSSLRPDWERMRRSSRRWIPALLLAAASCAVALSPVNGSAAPPATSAAVPAAKPSRAVGKPTRGSLVNGVLLPAVGEHYTTWDPGLRVSPGRDWRRWGTDDTVARVRCVINSVAAAHPDWPKLVIGDLSLPQGGPFGPEYGGLGHASHQNGLDVDVYYPRRDRAEVAPANRSEADFARSRELVDRFVAAGAEVIYVGRLTPLRSPNPVVEPARKHDDHFHVRFPNPSRPRPTTTMPTSQVPTSRVPISQVPISQVPTTNLLAGPATSAPQPTTTLPKYPACNPGT
jgi:murein endopeptidase